MSFWLQNIKKQDCVFKDVLDESHKEGPKHTCLHGKTLTTKTARTVLGLSNTNERLTKDQWEKLLRDLLAKQKARATDSSAPEEIQKVESAS